MRNTGWYIPYWRKPKKKGKVEKISTEEVWRSDEQLESVQQRWVERYRRTARAYRALGLSVGGNRAEAQARYNSLRAQGRLTRDVEDAYRYLLRVLPPMERRKRRPQGLGSGSETPNGPTRASLSVRDVQETVVSTANADASDASTVSVDLYVATVDVQLEDDDADDEIDADTLHDEE